MSRAERMGFLTRILTILKTVVTSDNDRVNDVTRSFLMRALIFTECLVNDDLPDTFKRYDYPCVT